MAARQRPWGGIALALILGAFGIWLALHLEWRDETTRTGFSGEARRNPYHAGMLLLTRSGYPARRLDDANVIDGLAPHSTLLLDSPALFNNKPKAARLRDWVQRGGHLVLPLTRRDDPDILLQAFGIQPLGWNQTPRRGQSITIEQSVVVADLSDAVIFDLATAPDWVATLPGYFDAPSPGTAPEAEEEAEDKTDSATARQAQQRPFHTDPFSKVPEKMRTLHAVYARWKLGQGYVTVGDFSPFRNEVIGEHDHGGLFMRLMSLPQDVRPVCIALTAEYPGLASWLIQHASEALLALAALLVAVLWRAMQRFGPQLPDFTPKRPGLLEHIGAVGDFLLQQKQYEALIAPLREDVVMRLTHLRGRHPEIATLQELGAHIAQLDVREVALALTPDPADPQDFQRRSQTLATLRHYCHSMQNTFSPEGN